MRILLIAIILFTCAPLWAQVNFVQNPDFEVYSSCPDDWNQIYKATGWRNPRDSAMEYGMEFYDTCGNSNFNMIMHVPENSGFYQWPHSGHGMAGAHFYYDKTPFYPYPTNYRDYLQSHLLSHLISGKEYCVSFWLNLAEAAGYGQNKIGAYLDNGNINISTDTPGAEILSVTPQIYTNDVLTDTGAWVKVEGSFIASGTEDHITIGNFFPNSSVSTVITDYYHGFTQYSYYLIDDISVVEINLSADAGPDNFVEETKMVQIGRVNDTTAKAIDCKWYHKGTLIDSGAVISVKAGAKGDKDTFVVVQTICGNIKTDTTIIYTVGLGMKVPASNYTCSIYPNPSDGNLNITSTTIGTGSAEAIVYDLTGRMISREQLSFNGANAPLKINAPAGVYFLNLTDTQGNTGRLRFVIR